MSQPGSLVFADQTNTEHLRKHALHACSAVLGLTTAHTSLMPHFQVGVDKEQQPPPPGVLKPLPRCSSSSELLVGQKVRSKCTQMQTAHAQDVQGVQ